MLHSNFGGFCLTAEFAEKLFDQLDQFAESSKRKAAVWPLQTMLLILCPVSCRLVEKTDRQTNKTDR